MSTFPCTACGQCCKSVKKKIEDAKNGIGEEPLKTLYLQFPYSYKEDGSCEKLDPETNKCTIYSKRPFLCEVERVYYHFFARKNVNIPLCDPDLLPKMPPLKKGLSSHEIKMQYAIHQQEVAEYCKKHNIKNWCLPEKMKPIRKQDFFMAVAQTCNQTIIDAGLDGKYLIKEVYSLPLEKQKK